MCRDRAIDLHHVRRFASGIGTPSAAIRLGNPVEFRGRSARGIARQPRSTSHSVFTVPAAGVPAKTAIRKQLVRRRYRTNRPSSLTERVRALSAEPLRLFPREIRRFSV